MRKICNKKKEKRIIYEEDYCTNITIFFSPAVAWKDFYPFSFLLFLLLTTSLWATDFWTENYVQHNINIGQPEIKWHANYYIKIAAYGFRKKRDLSCPMLVNRHVRPSYCLYSIIFSYLPVGILYIYCSNAWAHTQSLTCSTERMKENTVYYKSFSFIDSGSLLCNIRNICKYLIIKTFFILPYTIIKDYFISISF